MSITTNSIGASWLYFSILNGAVLAQQIAGFSREGEGWLSIVQRERTGPARDDARAALVRRHCLADDAESDRCTRSTR